MSEMTEVEKLRAAAAKAREEYERLSKVCAQNGMAIVHLQCKTFTH
jgi:hypothetical protein